MKIPLIDYILNVMKFVDAILSNNSTDDHCREFVAQGGLQPLLRILSLPNLPVDSPITASAQAVAAVCKSILVSQIPCFYSVFFESYMPAPDEKENKYHATSIHHFRFCVFVFLFLSQSIEFGP